MSKKRKGFDLQTKLNIFRELDKGVKRSDICVKFEIFESTLAGIIKDREKIHNSSATWDAVPKSKKIRYAKYADIEELLFDWFKNMREKSILIRGAMIKEKATTLVA